MKLLVFGGRGYDNEDHAFRVLDAVNARRPVTLVIQGGADGADALGYKWSREREIPCVTVWARWKAEGRSAGPKRNEKMLTDWRPDGAVMFPGGRGAADMKSRLDAASVKVMDAGPTHTSNAASNISR